MIPNLRKNSQNKVVSARIPVLLDCDLKDVDDMLKKVSLLRV